MLLALDTATQTASIALCDWPAYTVSGTEDEPPRLLAEWTWLARRRQTQDLLATVDHMLQLLDLTPRHLTGLAVTTGPGSFTGVRIAVSAAKGIALGIPHPLPTLGLPVLSVTASPWLIPAAAAGAEVWAYLQAGRGRINWCRFAGRDAWLWRPQAENHEAGDADALREALTQAGGPVWLVGEATAEVYAAGAHLSHVSVVDAISGARRAGHLAHLAVRHLRQRGTQDELTNPAGLQPLYLNTL